MHYAYDRTSDDFAMSPYRDPLSGNPQGSVLAVVAAKGGAGKSTLTLWLAEALTASGMTGPDGNPERGVVVVDANIGQPDIAVSTGLWKVAPGLGALISPRKFTVEQLERSLRFVEGLGAVLVGPAQPIDAAYADAVRALRLAVEMLSRRFSVVLIDTPVASSVERLFGDLIFDVAPEMLVVTNPHNVTLKDTASWLWEVAQPPQRGGHGIDTSTWSAVLNRASASSGVTADSVSKGLANVGVSLIAELPEVEGLVGATNQRRDTDPRKWQCPPACKDGVASIAAQLFGAHPAATAAADRKPKRKFRGR